MPLLARIQALYGLLRCGRLRKKAFFFEKKNEKTFAFKALAWRVAVQQWRPAARAKRAWTSSMARRSSPWPICWYIGGRIESMASNVRIIGEPERIFEAAASPVGDRQHDEAVQAAERRRHHEVGVQEGEAADEQP
jgi:hypothetical protein